MNVITCKTVIASWLFVLKYSLQPAPAVLCPASRGHASLQLLHPDLRPVCGWRDAWQGSLKDWLFLRILCTLCMDFVQDETQETLGGMDRKGNVVITGAGV